MLLMLDPQLGLLLLVEELELDEELEELPDKLDEDAEMLELLDELISDVELVLDDVLLTLDRLEPLVLLTEELEQLLELFD